ncbi:Putative mRNA-decapping enzyme subunit 1, PH-like domain superfamily [Septoria linicola]|uniref:mRNA-decapping enzyme subunit 1, PH-like domain superfamily n=1 Tax=Septoria linicola TaxID=215465 RepID=A0A9Q9ARW2_9PEZI|nr:Putative mRNA-decapping enzyme subunit 1, PH-like domain superfamily [Septoria linicola]
MPPNRKKSRQQPVSISDYESDTAAAGLTDTQPFIPAPPVRTNEALNLLVLRRWQPNVVDILTIAPFAVVYLFSAESQGWEKCEVQGSLFLCSLQSDPGSSGYKLLILNRKGLENWEFDIQSEDAIQVTEEYVIVQKEDEQGEQQIYGVWIFEEKGGHTRDVVGRAILGCAREVEALADQQEDYGGDEVYGEDTAQDDAAEGYSRQQGDDVRENSWPRQETPRQESHHQQQQPFGIPPQHQPQGQQIDLAALFGKSAPAPSVQPPPTSINIGGTNFTSTPFTEERLAAQSAIPSHHAGPRFPASGDTDFFRGTSSPAQAQPTYHQPQQSMQQNTLLGLFNNAKRG